MPEGDLFRVTLKATYTDNVVMRNTFWYQQVGATDVNLDSLMVNMWATLSSSLLDVTSEVVSYKETTAWKYGSEDAPVVDTFDTPGGNEAEALPPSIAFSFRLNRSLTTTRNGFKRFGGVCETQVLNGIVTDGPTLAKLATVATALGATLTQDGWSARPVIVRFKIGNQVLTTPLVNPVRNAGFSGLGTQNSRKFGHGE